MSARPVMLRLLRLLGTERRRMAPAVLLAFATVASGIGLMMAAAWLIARAALHPSIAVLGVAIAGVRFFGLARGIFRYLERLLTHSVTFRLLARLRVRFYAALVPLAPARLGGFRSGDLLGRIVSDIESLEFVFARLFAPPLVALLIAALVAVVFNRFDRGIALVLLGGFAFGGFALPALMERLGRPLGERLVRIRAEIQSMSIDGIQGMADLLVFNRADAYRAEFDAKCDEWVRLQRRMTVLTGGHEALGGLIMNATVLAVLWRALPLAHDGRLDGVLLPVVALGVLAAFEAVAPLPQAFQFLRQSRDAARRVFELADTPPAVAAPAIPAPAPAGFGLEFRDVSFAYAPDAAPVLRGVDFALLAGARVAVVGASGAGKSTLAHLLLRFWDVTGGSIRLGGRDLREFDPDVLPKYIGVVSQLTWLFNGTVRDNLHLARPEATEAELCASLEDARLLDFVRTLPEGIDTRIGEQGLQLSGGQRRRLSLAQAFLRDTPILVLDEPTADLDAETEREVMDLVWSVGSGRTLLVITHRLVRLDRADRILVLHEGRFEQQGTHAELAAQPGFYRRLLDLQPTIG